MGLWYFARALGVRCVVHVACALSWGTCFNDEEYSGWCAVSASASPVCPRRLVHKLVTVRGVIAVEVLVHCSCVG